VEQHPVRHARRTVIAIIPVRAIEGAKSRLGAVLDAEERRDLAERLARRTIAASVATPGISETLVITPDDSVRALALEAGARPIRQRTSGLNEGLREARDEAVAAGADAVLVLPIDLPEITAAAIGDVVAGLDQAGEEPGDPVVVIVADRHGRGTNALLLAPPDAIDFQFGGDSRHAHVRAATTAAATLVELGGPLALDLDTPEDLLLAQAAEPEMIGG
jgi:2-phospho-L-lactate/phosphoenolpyruvate guanylyltransferase